jgi:hypothetical protein
MKILNDKFGLSYLSGNAQILYANTASLQQFDTIIANTFTTTGNVFTVNVGGVYSNGFFATQGNISAANIIISGNLFLGGTSGSTYQYIQKSATGIAWVNSTFDGGLLLNPLVLQNQLVATSISSANVVITGGYLQTVANVYATGVVNSGSIQTPNLNITTGATITGALVTGSLSTANARITGGYLQTVSNVYTTGVVNADSVQVPNLSVTTGATITGALVTGSFSTANARITGGYLQTVANLYATGVVNGGSVQTPNLSVTTGATVTGRLLASNFDSANVAIRGGYIGGGAGVTVANVYASGIGNFGSIQTSNVNVSGNVTSANLTTGNISATGNISTPAYLSTNTFAYTSAIIEPVAIFAGTGPSGEMNIDLMANSTHYYTPVATGLWTPNVRAGATTPLNDMMAVGRQITFSMIVNQGATPRNNNSGNLRIDNTWYTAKWPNATAPTAIANRTEIYTYTLIKTAAGTWVVLGASSTNA